MEEADQPSNPIDMGNEDVKQKMMMMMMMTTINAWLEYRAGAN